MKQDFQIGDLYDAQNRTIEKGAMSRVLYDGTWLTGLITRVDCRSNTFTMEIPDEFSYGKLDIGKVEKVEEIKRVVEGLEAGGAVKIWVDDIRPVPDGYEGTKSVAETIALIEQIEEAGGRIEVIDLDHDLGDYAWLGGDAIKILDYLVMEEKFYPVCMHTANPVGQANMERMIERYWP